MNLLWPPAKISALFIFVFFLAPIPSAWADVVVVDEQFSGTGDSSAGGLTGFDEDGWNLAGAVGSFQTSSFGESVYRVSSTGDQGSGVSRGIEFPSFQALVEMSDLEFNGSLSGAYLLSANSLGFAQVGIFPVGSGYRADFFFDSRDGNGYDLIGSQSLNGLLERSTFLLDYRTDSESGIGSYEAMVEFNEDGLWRSLGRVEESFGNATGRFLSAFAYGRGSETASVGFDRFLVSVPEPATASILLAVSVFGVLRRRRELNQR